MKNLLIGTMIAAAVAVPAAPAIAQYDSTSATTTTYTTSTTTYREPMVRITPYAGYMDFGNDFASPQPGLTFSAGNAAIVGGELSVALGRYAAVVGNVGFTKPTWNFSGPAAPASSSDASMWLYDGSLRLRLPLGQTSESGPARFVPFVQGGVGGITYSLSNNPFNANGTTSWAFNAGAGADIMMSDNFGVRLQAKDYITSLNWDKASNVSLNSKTSNNWAFTGGFIIGF